jgi:hypothetical protein
MHENLSQPQSMNNRIEKVRSMILNKGGIFLSTMSKDIEITTNNERSRNIITEGS